MSPANGVESRKRPGEALERVAIGLTIAAAMFSALIGGWILRGL